jgi:SAM-dependent methyltransferase
MSWADDPGFWAELGPILFAEERGLRVSGHIDAMSGWSAMRELLGRAGGWSGLSVLDAPCGTGFYAVELARRGARVTGLDLFEAHVEATRQRAGAAGVELDARVADLRSWAPDPAERFDVVFCLHTSIGYWGDRQVDREIVRRLASAVRAGGLLVIDSLVREALVRHFEPVRYAELGGYVVEDRVEVDPLWQRARVTMTGHRDGQERCRSFDLELYGAAELEAMIGSVATVVGVERFDGLTSVPFGVDATRLAVAARIGEAR